MLASLLLLPSDTRVRQFKTLSTSQAKRLLADMQQPLEEKHEDDLNEVIAMYSE